MMFARAVGDANPVYYGGPDFIANRPQVIAPPTFVEASMHYDPDFVMRPQLGKVWFGSAREPSGGDPPRPAVGPGDTNGTSFHAETHLEYFDTLHPGDILEVNHRTGETWEKKGLRGGRLWFSSRIADFEKGGKTAVRAVTVAVTTEHKIDPTVPTAAPATSHVAAPARNHTSSAPVKYPVPPVPARELKTGDCRDMLLVENLSRGQILLYAGASGDFSPQHTDEIWNTKVAGYPTIFAHGMLTMGMTARILTDWFGDRHLRRFGLRFARSVWPGDTLTAKAVVQKIDETAGTADTALVDLVVSTRNGRGGIVATGYATVELSI
jgi:acyl dehydratase